MGLNLGGGFAQGVMQGQSIFKHYNDQFEQAQQRRDLAEIADAKAVDSTGFTPDQGKALDNAVAAGFDNVTFDDKNNAYVAKNAAGESKSIAMGGVTDFLGKRTATLTPEQQDAARVTAMADVIGKTDPIRGLQLRSQARREQRDTMRDAREDKQWAQEDAITAIDNGLGKDFQASLVDAEGKPRSATVDDYLANSQKRIAALNAGGHAKAAAEELQKNLAWTHTKIQLDGKQREEAFGKAAYAAANGDYAPMQDAYNKFVPDGMKITGMEVGKDGSITMNRTGANGSAVEPKVFKNRDELLATMNTLNNPMALYQYAGSEQQRALQLKADTRADHADRRADNADRRSAAADGRAAESHAETMRERREIRSVRETLGREADPTASDARIRAYRSGVLQIPGAEKGNSKYDYDPMKVQKAFGDVTTDSLSGKETVRRNMAEEQKFQDFLGNHPEIRDVDEGLVKYNRMKIQANAAERQKRVSETVSAMTPEMIAKTAKRRGITEDQVIEQLKKAGISR